MPTYEVECRVCGKPKWPTLPSRPYEYVCALCMMVTPQKKAEQQKRGRLAARTRRESAP